MLRFKQRSKVPPPGNFIFVHPETGWRVKAGSWSSLHAAVLEYHIANSFPVPVDFNERVEDNACHQVPASAWEQWVVERGKEWVPVQKKAGWRGIQDYLRGTMAIFENVAKGGQKVGEDEANRRAEICSRCEFNISPDDCKSCKESMIERTVQRVIGNARTRWHGQLNSCWWCGCFLKAAVWWPLDILQRWQSDESSAQLPSWCWKKKG